MKHNLEKNKQNAIAFYRTACMGDPQKAVELYIGANLHFSQIKFIEMVSNCGPIYCPVFNKLPNYSLSYAAKCRPRTIQHNPLVRDGKKAFIAYFHEMAK